MQKFCYGFTGFGGCEVDLWHGDLAKDEIGLSVLMPMRVWIALAL